MILKVGSANNSVVKNEYVYIKQDEVLPVKSESEKTNFEFDEKNRKSINISAFSDLSKDHFNFLLNHAFNKKANDALAGHLKTSYYYNDWPKDFEEYLINKVINDDDLMNEAKEKKLIKEDPSLFLNVLWINKQKKHEFNPIHFHTGVFSFIIPMQIPYDLNEEDRNLHGGSESGLYTSRLSFVACKNNDLVVQTMNVDQSYVGKVLMFSSSLNHQVYPFFTSDDERITVSGNILRRDWEHN